MHQLPLLFGCKGQWHHWFTPFLQKPALLTGGELAVEPASAGGEDIDACAWSEGSNLCGGVSGRGAVEDRAGLFEDHDLAGVEEAGIGGLGKPSGGGSREEEKSSKTYEKSSVFCSIERREKEKRPGP